MHRISNVNVSHVDALHVNVSHFDTFCSMLILYYFYMNQPVLLYLQLSLHLCILYRVLPQMYAENCKCTLTIYVWFLLFRSPKKTIVDRNDVLRTYDSLTEDDLVLVATRTSEKNYDQNGTTCHQCRQKTDDLKTICRSDSCFGVRGQFCGPCLKNRYGEDAKMAIMDKTWICPPCRGICNCSFCMAKRGRRATGILIHLAKEKGFESVKAFLGD